MVKLLYITTVDNDIKKSYKYLMSQINIQASTNPWFHLKPFSIFELFADAPDSKRLKHWYDLL